MTESTEEFREELQRVIRRHDPDPEQLRDAAGDFEEIADRFEEIGEVL
ncbi:hypothetical protein [Halorussus marinus]|nr:hypothetical protein [Halorussus marinus]